MCFLRKIIFHFPSKEKRSYYREKGNTIFPDITKDIIFQCDFFVKTIFSEHLKKTSYFHVYFRERLSFFFLISYFPETEISSFVIIFQCDFFRKTIFSEHLEKENVALRVVLVLVSMKQQT